MHSSQVNPLQPLAFFYFDERSEERRVLPMKSTSNQKLDVLVCVTTINYMRLFSNSMVTLISLCFLKRH